MTDFSGSYYRDEDDQAWIDANWPTAVERCTCFDPKSMEFRLEPCDFCKAKNERGAA